MFCFVLRYVVDGTPYDRSKENHIWNRVYVDGVWWDVDVTNDILATQNSKKIYSFRELESITFPDEDYLITKIY